MTWLPPPKDRLCCHCRTRPLNWSLDVCLQCLQIPGIREQYLDKSDKLDDFDDEPTQEELDAMIAKQMKNLPHWWDRETLKNDQEEYP